MSSSSSLVDIPTARRLLGDVSPQTIYRLIHDGELTLVKVRRRSLLRRRDLEEFIARQAEAA